MSVAQEQWITLSEAAKRFGVSVSKLSLMGIRGEIRTRRDPKDKRKVLVSVNELSQLFYPPPQ